MAGRLNEKERLTLLARVEQENPDYYQNYSLMMADLPDDFSFGQVKHMKEKFKELRTTEYGTEWKLSKLSDREQLPGQDIPDDREKSGEQGKTLRELASELGVPSPQTVKDLEDQSRVETLEAEENPVFRSTYNVNKTWLLIYATHFQVSPRYLLGVSADANEWIDTDEKGNPILDGKGKHVYLIQPLAVMLPYEIMTNQCINAMFPSKEGRSLLSCFADLFVMTIE